MSWVIIHLIDDESPLKGVDWKDPGGHVLAISAILTGHDVNYSQQVYARHVYQPDHLRVGHRFVDVLTDRPDGRIQVDYGLFHDTLPDGLGPYSPAP
jgi:inward rectifier potassium channel